MSLIRIATRIAAVQALKGKTLAGMNVFDSRIGALDVGADGALRTDQDRPFVAVYTDSSGLADTQGKPTFPDATSRAFVPNGLTTVAFEIGVASNMVETDPETGEANIVTGIPVTDDAMELYLDIVARQVGDALSDPTNAWGELFRRFVLSIRNVERLRVASDANGIRLAAQQIRVTADLAADPVRGVPLKDGSPLGAFFDHAEATMRVPNPAHLVSNPGYPDNSSDPLVPNPAEPETVVDPVIASTLALMRAQIDAAPAPFDWQTAQRRFGFHRSEADALLITPPAGVPGDTAVAIKDQPGAEANTPSIIWQPNDRSPL